MSVTSGNGQVGPADDEHLTAGHEPPVVVSVGASGTADSDRGLEADAIPDRRTPFYRAQNNERYNRQAQIRDIEKNGRRLISIVSGTGSMLIRQDVLALHDLLCDIPAGSNVDLLLHTMGGDVDAAEKLALMLRSTVEPDGELRVIVPEAAKSSGTLLSLVADEIVMSDSSELGPIDPQLMMLTPEGWVRRPAQSYIDAFESTAIAIASQGPLAAAHEVMLDKFDPVQLEICRRALKRSREFAEKFLKQYMFGEEGGRYTEVAAKLCDDKRWHSHAAVISADDAKVIGLKVHYIAGEDPAWAPYWRLFLEQRLEVRDDHKLFEGRTVSLHIPDPTPA